MPSVVALWMALVTPPEVQPMSIAPPPDDTPAMPVPEA